MVSRWISLMGFTNIPSNPASQNNHRWGSWKMLNHRPAIPFFSSFVCCCSSCSCCLVRWLLGLLLEIGREKKGHPWKILGTSLISWCRYSNRLLFPCFPKSEWSILSCFAEVTTRYVNGQSILYLLAPNQPNQMYSNLTERIYLQKGIVESEGNDFVQGNPGRQNIIR